MFSLGNSAGSTGNPLFPSTTNTATQIPITQPQITGFQFGTIQTPSTSNFTSIGAGTTGSETFKFGTSNNAPTGGTGTSSSSSFNFGGILWNNLNILINKFFIFV